MKTATTLVPTECAYCDAIGYVKPETLGHPTLCCRCNKPYRAIETLPVMPAYIRPTREPIEHQSSSGSLLTGLAYVAAFYVALGVIAWWVL